MAHLPTYISSELTRLTDPAGRATTHESQNTKLRHSFGFDPANAASLSTWTALLRLDALMGMDPDPNPALGTALGHEHGKLALELARNTMDGFSSAFSDLTLRVPIELRRSAIERKAQRARSDILALGLSPEQADALITHCFVQQALRSAETALHAGRIEPLVELCKTTLNLGSNLVLVELAVGTLGSWLYHEATNLNHPRDFCLALPWEQLASSANVAPPIIHWVVKLLSRLEAHWDFSNTLPIDESNLSKLSAMIDFVDSFSDQGSKSLDPPDCSRLRALIESQSLSRALHAPSQAPQTKHKQKTKKQSTSL